MQIPFNVALFKFVRNPIFSGLLISFAGLTLLSLSPWIIMGWLFTTVLISIQVRLEEQHLLKIHGDDYDKYAGQVGRFVPGLGKL